MLRFRCGGRGGGEVFESFENIHWLIVGYEFFTPTPPLHLTCSPYPPELHPTLQNQPSVRLPWCLFDRVTKRYKTQRHCPVHPELFFPMMKEGTGSGSGSGSGSGAGRNY